MRVCTQSCISKVLIHNTAVYYPTLQFTTLLHLIKQHINKHNTLHCITGHHATYHHMTSRHPTIPGGARGRLGLVAREEAIEAGPVQETPAFAKKNISALKELVEQNRNPKLFLQFHISYHPMQYGSW